MNKPKGQVKGRWPGTKALRILKTIPMNPEAAVAREDEFCRQDSLVEKAVSMVLKDKATTEAQVALRIRLREALDQHLERLEDEARLGRYREVRGALSGIGAATAHLLGLLRHAPPAALDRLGEIPEGREELTRLVERQGLGGLDRPLGWDREVFEARPPDSRKSPNGLVRRLAALETLAKLAVDGIEAEMADPDVMGAKSIRQARTGRTPDLDLFEDCTRILGPMKKLARLTDVARLLQEAATNEDVPSSWGRDHSTRARRWWRMVGSCVGTPLARVPEAKRELVLQGLAGIKLPNRRGQGESTSGARKKSSKSKTTTRSKEK